MKPVPRIALVYDRVNTWGGAERVLLALHQLFPDAPLYTSVYDPLGAPWANEFMVRTSWLQNIPWLRRRHRLVGWLMPLAFESLNLDEFEIVISVTSEFAKAVLTKPQQLHLCYLLTPTRYLWSHQENYLAQLPDWLRAVACPVVAALQQWDRVLALRPDVYVPISQLVAQRCEEFYARPSKQPLYPPVSALPHATSPAHPPALPFFFTWGRHVPYKALDVAIPAAVDNQQQLVIAGSGPQTSAWQDLAHRLDPDHRFIQFIGRINDAELAWYLQAATAAVFPQEEDFGLTVLEAMSQGCPVIVHQRSGAAELMRPGKDGLFLEETNVAMLRAAMAKAMTTSWSRLDIQRQAGQYAEAKWQTTFFDTVMTTWQQHQKQYQKQNEGRA